MTHKIDTENSERSAVEILGDLEWGKPCDNPDSIVLERGPWLEIENANANDDRTIVVVEYTTCTKSFMCAAYESKIHDNENTYVRAKRFARLFPVEGLVV